MAKQNRQHALNWLADKFPEAFDNRIRIRPLKIGIMADVLTYADEAIALRISKSKIREAIALYTRQIDYLTCLKAKELRVDLSGKLSAAVTDEEAQSATQKIKKRIEKSAKHARQALHKTASNLPRRQSTNQYSQSSRTAFEKPLQSNTTINARSGPSITIKRKIPTSAE